MTTTQKKINQSDEWVKSSSRSLVNERDIAIFAMGKEKGAKEEKDKLDDRIKNLFSKSYEDTSVVLDTMKELGVRPVFARLKLQTLNYLNVIIAVFKSDFTPDKAEKIYNFLSEFEEKKSTKEYNIDFSIFKAPDGFSDTAIENDGYIYKHQSLLNEKSSRPTQSQS